VVSDAAILNVFNGPPAGWKVEAFRVDWDNPASTPLDAKNYISTLLYDALNRAKEMTYPEDVENQRRKLTPRYNRAGALESVALERPGAGGAPVSDTFVERIAYNAKGQRVLIAYGNGIMTRHAYDPHTFRLTHLRTDSYIKTTDLTYHPTGQPFQEFGYDYDLVGNIWGMHDRTPGSGINGSVVGIDSLDRKFTYDALYRLRSATGRECDIPPDVPWDNGLRCTDLTKTRPYTEQYLCDVVGNIEQLKHLSNGAGFTRDFDLMAGNNRLSKLTIGTTDFNYQCDANGNMIGETTSRHFEWDWADRMKGFRTQTGGSEPSVHTHYLYDAGGQRVKKLVRKQGGKIEVTVYNDGIFEYQRIVQGGAVEENNTLHVMDNQSRIALMRVGNPFPDDTTPAVKYHLGDHLRSSNLVIDDFGSLVNREEYTPYGETSFGSFARKRYRYTGKERDEESRLYYHGARYYAPWLGRWSNPDPAGTTGGINLYQFVRLNPMIYTDKIGLEPDDKLTQDTKAFNDKWKASDEKLTNIGEQYTEHVKQYQGARETYEKYKGRQGTEENIKRVEKALNEDMPKAVSKLQRDEELLRDALAERTALRTEAKALEKRQLASLQADWDAQQAATRLANQQVSRMQGGRSGPWGGPAAPPMAPSSPRPTEVPTHFSVRAGREALNATKESEVLLAQTVRKTVEAAEIGIDLRQVVKVLSEVEAAEAASAAGRAGRLGKVLKIGGTVLFLADLATGGANEAGVWDVVSAPVRGAVELAQEGTSAAKSAVKAWLSLGARLNLEIGKGTPP
jgi:RHS repeat-associated protein